MSEDVPCPYCAETIPEDSVKCPECGESLDEQDAPAQSGTNVVLIVVVVLVAMMLLCAVTAIIAAIAIPNMVPVRKPGNEAGAIGALKTISMAQMLFREGDKEEDGNLDYGTLEELANAGTTGLIDSILGSGTKQGYLFECTYAPQTSEFLWMATARPVLPGTTGDRYFATNHEGVTYYSDQAPIPITPDCTIPQGQGIKPVGR